MLYFKIQFLDEIVYYILDTPRCDQKLNRIVIYLELIKEFKID